MCSCRIDVRPLNHPRLAEQLLDVVQAGDVVQAAAGRAAARVQHLLRRLLRRHRRRVVLIAVVAAVEHRTAVELRLAAAAVVLPRMPRAA